MLLVGVGHVVGILEELVEERADLAPPILDQLEQERRIGALVDEEVEFLVEMEVGAAVALRDRRVDVPQYLFEPLRSAWSACCAAASSAGEALERAADAIELGELSRSKAAARRSNGSAA